MCDVMVLQISGGGSGSRTDCWRTLHAEGCGGDVAAAHATLPAASLLLLLMSSRRYMLSACTVTRRAMQEKEGV